MRRREFLGVLGAATAAWPLATHAREPVVLGGGVGGVDLQIGLVRHLLDVGAGRKRLVQASEHDAADPGGGIQSLDRRQELAPERGVERVQRLRPIEADEADPAAGFDDDGFGGPGCRGSWVADIAGGCQPGLGE